MSSRAKATQAMKISDEGDARGVSFTDYFSKGDFD